MAEDLIEQGTEVDLLKVVRDKLTMQRRILNKTQINVAEEGDVSSALVHLFEKGHQRISIDKLAKIAAVLGMRIVIDAVPVEEQKTGTL